MIFRPPPPEVGYVLVGVIAALAVASLVTATLRARRPDKDYTEVTARVRTWWVIVVLFGGAMLLGRGASLVFFAFASFLGLKEYLSLIPTRRADRRVLFWAYLAIPAQYALVYMEWYGVFIIFIPVYMFFLLPTRALLVGRTEGFINAMATLHWGLMTTVFSLSHAAYLLVITLSDPPRVTPHWPSEQGAADPGAGLLLLLVLLTQANDVAQYLWGKSIGVRKVAPKVSPNKTWGGVIGGVATTIVLAALIGPALSLLDAPRALLAGLIIGVAGFFGDLSMSALKRDLGVKDTGTTLPGHGGVLDRVDSLSYAAPLFFHYVYFLY